MEKLRSLESSLPPEQPPTKQAIDSLNTELSQEFKVAANAVTRLYRVANEKNSLLKHQGYIECLDDILKVLQSRQAESLGDLHLWCLKQRNDRLQGKEMNNSTSLKPSSGLKGEESEYDFHFDKRTNNNSPNFRISMPPLTVEHTKPSQNSDRYKTRLRQQRKNNEDAKLDKDLSDKIELMGSIRGKPAQKAQSTLNTSPNSHMHSFDFENNTVKKPKLDTEET